MQTGETANLSVLDGHDVVYLERSNSPRVLSIGFQAGARIPGHVVAPGFAVLSTYTQEKLDEWIASHDFARFTPTTITDKDKFREAVVSARTLGYWAADQYLDSGLAGIAAALFDRQGRCIGAISITYQTHAYPDGTVLTTLLPALQDAVQVLRQVI